MKLARSNLKVDVGQDMEPPEAFREIRYAQDREAFSLNPRHYLGGKFGPHNIHMPHEQSCFEDVETLIHFTYESGGLWLFDITHPGAPRQVGYFIPSAPKKKLGLLPNELNTQTEEIVVDNRGYIYITDKNHGLFILRRRA